MSVVGAALENHHPEPGPRLLLELPSWRGVFLGNLRDLLFRRRLAPLEFSSGPGEFWPDVFVAPRLPWSRLVQSAICHVLAVGILVGISQLLALRPRVVLQARPFDHSQVISYRASDYLPPLDTRPRSSATPGKADPELAPQPIISIPHESDNRSQTIVAPPNIKLRHEIAMPNVVAWSDSAQKPQLEIPTAPVIPASEVKRLAPDVEMANSIVTPAPDAAHIERLRSSPPLQSSVVAPPPDLRQSRAHSALEGLQPVLITPPPDIETGSVRQRGQINIGPSEIIAPAPRLPTAPQRTSAVGALTGTGAGQVVPPPPTVSASAAGGLSAGSRGRLIALNLHPSITAPPAPPARNRRGTFATAPEGHSGASGSTGLLSEGSKAGTRSGSAAGNGAESARNTRTDLPTGLYVGKPGARPAALAGNPSGRSAANSANSNLAARVRPPRETSLRTSQPEIATKLSQVERTVFGDRKFYSATLNMPNLNSGGGSWVIRFAELTHGPSPRDSTLPVADLSQPMPTRKVDPAYPMQLMRENVSGTVILYAVIHADGTVGNVRVLRGVDERLDRFASEALAQWKFDPATKNGEPVDVEATFQIPFRPSPFATNF